MLAHALQDIDEIGVRVDTLEPASRNQALHDASVLGADLGPAKEPVLFAARHRGVILPMSGRKSKSSIVGTHCMGAGFGSNTASDEPAVMSSTSRFPPV